METDRSVLDRWLEACSRTLARRTSRRGLLGRLGLVLLGASGVPLLPVARGAAGPEEAARGAPDPDGPAGDPTACEYWRYCAIDGFLCSCCGGAHNACPPGSEMSPVTWIGTCRNPLDGRDYLISYNDCCGKGFCGRCFCNRNEGDKPGCREPGVSLHGRSRARRRERVLRTVGACGAGRSSASRSSPSR
jgi:methylamine dehydrogenase light chain